MSDFKIGGVGNNNFVPSLTKNLESIREITNEKKVLNEDLFSLTSAKSNFTDQPFGMKENNFSTEKIPLFENIPGLEKKVKRIELVKGETPVAALKDLEKSIGSQANLFIKRDDLSSPLYGGNKARKLEFTLAKILDQGSRRIITGGGLGSHMTVAMAAFGKQYHIPVETILFKQPLNEHVKNNLKLDKYFSASMEYSSNYVSFAADLARKYLSAWITDKKRPYLVLPGDSNTLSNLGYVNAAFELKKQISEGKIPEPDYLFVAAGSCGTMAGLSAGLKMAGLKTKVVGVQVSEGFVTNPATVTKLANKTIDFINKNGDLSTPVSKIKEEEVIMLTNYLGKGYGHPVEKAEKAISLLKNTEGVKLDPTYTGKAMAAMLDFAARPQNKGKNILFLNTYNSRDLSQEAGSVNPKDLPKDFRKFF